MSIPVLVATVLYGSVLGAVFVLLHMSRFNRFCALVGCAGGLLGLVGLALFAIEFHFYLWRVPEIAAIPAFFLTGYAMASPLGHLLARYRHERATTSETRGYIW